MLYKVSLALGLAAISSAFACQSDRGFVDLTSQALTNIGAVEILNSQHGAIAEKSFFSLKSYSAAHSNAVSIEEFLDQQDRHAVTLRFRSSGTKTSVTYGQFRAAFGPGTPHFTILNILYHEPQPRIAKGDFGLVIVPGDPSGKPALLQIGEASFIKSARASPEASDCWTPRAGEDGIFVGREDANGILYYRNGWRWAFCGD